MKQGTAIRQKAFQILSRRPYSRARLRDKLSEAASPELLDEVLDELEEQGYLDDEKLARQRASTCRQRRLWGDFRIQLDLRKLGISAAITSRILAELNQERPQQEALKRVIALWIQQKGRPESAARLKKLFGHCSRRGFPSSLIREAFHTLELLH